MTNNIYLKSYDWLITKCEQYFTYLVEDYGYKLALVDVQGYELRMCYRFADVRGLVITYEYPALPTIIIGGESVVEGKLVARSIYVEDLIRVRCPEKRAIKLIIENRKSVGELNEKDRLTHDEVLMVLKHYSEIIKEFGKDVLLGDYTGLQVMP